MSEYATTEAPTFPAAELDRRFYAFTLDRLLSWSVDLGIALAAYHFLIARDRVWAGVLALVAGVLLVGLVYSLLLGRYGISPGKAAVGLRVVHHGTGTPIGIGPAMLRSLVLGVSAMPTFGLGVATLAWTAVMDRGGQRRGWHDHISHGIVVDVRPVPVEAEEAQSAPRHIVNLTAMRLVPAPQAAPVSTPARVSRPAPSAPRPSGPPSASPASQAQPPALVPAAEPAAPAPTPVPAAATEDAQPAAKRKLQVGPPLVGPSTPRQGGAPPAGPPVEQPSGRHAVAGPAAVERTMIRTGEEGTVPWRVSFDSGGSFLVEGLALVGRRPEPRQGEPVRHLVPLRSADMSLSKTHAQFQVAPDGVLVVMDRGSTNGSILIRQGATRALTAGTPTSLVDGDQVRFGDRTMSVAHEG